MASLVWVGAVAIVAVWWTPITDILDKLPGKLPSIVGPVLVLVAVLIGIFTHDRLGDALAPKRISWEHDMSDVERRQHLRKEAEQAEKQGRIGAAMLLFEDAGFFNRALELAERLSDKPGLARLSCRLGHYGRARKLYLQLKDYEAAAHTSVLMKEIDTAREYYRQAAESCKGNIEPAMEAGLWERAGEREVAAKLYEEGLRLDRAAECYKLLGDMENSVRCTEEAKVMENFDRKQRGENRRAQELRIKQERTYSAGQAKELEAIGDYFGAGLHFRTAGMLMEAAHVFEDFEEWERAAECYEKAGQLDRAELARMHIEKPELDIRETPPDPSEAPSAQFNLISQPIAVPVYVAASGELPGSPAARLEVCKRVRRGNFTEAAEFAKANGDWIMAAAYYEHDGNFLAAADVYRQIGDVNAGAFCLDQAGRQREAAFLMLASGQSERAAQFLVQALKKHSNVRENGLTLGDLLIQWQKYALAQRLLMKCVCPHIIDDSTAEIYYQFAQRFVEREAWTEADAIYQRLVEAGVRSENVVRDAQEVAERAAEAKEHEIKPGDSRPDLAELDKIDSIVREFLDSLPEPPEKPSQMGADKTFIFELAAAGAEGEEKAAGGTFVFQPQQFSLFGRSVGDKAQSACFGEDGRLITDLKEGTRDEVDPFASGQRYERKAELGRGGMGVVYEALDTVLGRRVALKLILEHLANQEAYDRFLLEARAIAVLSHPNVIVIYDIGLMDFQHYIAMEFVDGGSVGKWIEKKKALPLKEALRVFIETSRGLQAAHRAGVVHRDIKPDNILLTGENQVKIGDFGLASVKRATNGKDEKEPFQASGTPGFIAPEQFYGAEVAPAFDIYALGITLFTMLVGRPPYELANKTTLREIVKFQKSGELIPLRRFRPNSPEAIEQIYEYCAAPDPKDRYKSIDAFLPTIEAIYESLD